MIITREYCDLCKSEFVDKGPLCQEKKTWMEISKRKRRTWLLFCDTETYEEKKYTICGSCENKLKQWVKENTVSKGA